MKTFFCSLAALAALSFPVMGQDAHPHVKGEVFIVTRGGENFRLGRVEIFAFDYAEILSRIKEAKDKAAPIIAKLSPHEARYKSAYDAARSNISYGENFEATEAARDAAEKQWVPYSECIEYLNSESYYFNDAIKAKELASCKTDSDGKYDIALPALGKYALAALGSRYTGETTELYCWLLSADASKGDISLTFSNDNMGDAGGGESMIPAGPYRSEVPQDKIDKLIADTEQQAKAAEEEAQKRLMDQYRADPLAAQKSAILLYPDLGAAGTPLNKEFARRYNLYKASNPHFFDEPDWPIRLAKECAESVHRE